MVESSSRRLGELHVQRARNCALRLHAATTSVFPRPWMERVVEEVTIDLLDFGFHARRVNELCRLHDHKFLPINNTAYQISENDPGKWESKYQYALNALHHSQAFTFGNVNLDHRTMFGSSCENLAPMYVKINTDKFPDEVTISVFGIVHCFLIEVIACVKDQQPDWQF